jgi:hypothetical protein
LAFAIVPNYNGTGTSGSVVNTARLEARRGWVSITTVQAFDAILIGDHGTRQDNKGGDHESVRQAVR